MHLPCDEEDPKHRSSNRAIREDTTLSTMYTEIHPRRDGGTQRNTDQGRLIHRFRRFAQIGENESLEFKTRAAEVSSILGRKLAAGTLLQNQASPVRRTSKVQEVDHILGHDPRST